MARLLEESRPQCLRGATGSLLVAWCGSLKNLAGRIFVVGGCIVTILIWEHRLFKSLFTSKKQTDIGSSNLGKHGAIFIDWECASIHHYKFESISGPFLLWDIHTLLFAVVAPSDGAASMDCMHTGTVNTLVYCIATGTHIGLQYGYVSPQARQMRYDSYTIATFQGMICMIETYAIHFS